MLDRKLNILVVEDHLLVAEGIRALLLKHPLIKKVELAKNGLEGIKKAKTVTPDLIIMDYDMPIYNGIYATEQILESFPEMPVLMVSVNNKKEILMEAIRAKVKGFLTKSSGAEDMIQAVKALSNGKRWFKGNIAEMLAEEMIDRSTKTLPPKNILTRRQTELIPYFAEGLTHTEIAETLKISTRTVETHKTNIYKKLNLRNNTELMRYAIKNKLVKI
ncbi:MAG: response regulator transcription factor [Bacteroidales bacterium]